MEVPSSELKGSGNLQCCSRRFCGIDVDIHQENIRVVNGVSSALEMLGMYSMKALKRDCPAKTKG